MLVGSPKDILGILHNFLKGKEGLVSYFSRNQNAMLTGSE